MSEGLKQSVLRIVPGAYTHLVDSYFLDPSSALLTTDDLERELQKHPPFTASVLRACSEIPSGQTITYGQLAQRIGRPTASRAVANALGRNRCPLLIPCHRIVAANGPGGYAFGKELKKKLLKFEREFARQN